MSRSVDLFISAPEPLDELATEVGRIIGRGLVRMAGPDRWLLEEDGVGAVLSAHAYADDGNLFFSHYRYALSARVGNSSRPQDSAEAALLRRVAHKLQSGSKWPVLLVLDLQYRDQKAEAAEPSDASEPTERVEATERVEPTGPVDPQPQSQPQPAAAAAPPAPPEPPKQPEAPEPDADAEAERPARGRTRAVTARVAPGAEAS
jgi:hypothetical protein